MKTFKEILTILQLDHKLVRAMLLISVVLVIGVFFFPVKKPVIMEMKELSGKPLMDTTIMLNDSTRTRVLIRRQPINVHMPLAATKSLDDETNSLTSAKEPVKVQIVEESKPIDWKTLTTWIIGAINGLVLMVLNVKNILKKTP